MSRKTKPLSCKDWFKDKPQCLESSDSRNQVICLDKDGGKSKYTLTNKTNQPICKYKVDGCLIASSTQKQTDFLLIHPGKMMAYLVELKGSDLLKAVKQIDASLNALRLQEELAINARIVLTRVNSIALRDTQYLRLKKRMKSLGGSLKQQTQQMQETIA